MWKEDIIDDHYPRVGWYWSAGRMLASSSSILVLSSTWTSMDWKGNISGLGKPPAMKMVPGSAVAIILAKHQSKSVCLPALPLFFFHKHTNTISSQILNITGSHTHYQMIQRIGYEWRKFSFEIEHTHTHVHKPWTRALFCSISKTKSLLTF